MRRRSRTVLFALVMMMFAGVVLSTTVKNVRRFPRANNSEPCSASPETHPPLPAECKAAETPEADHHVADNEPVSPTEPEIEIEEGSPPEPVEWQQSVQTPGFPVRRMRLKKPDNPNVFPPEDLYLENRVVLNQVAVSRDGIGGMQISGSVYTDFIADCVPHNRALPTGQLLGLQLDIELFALDSILHQDVRTTKLNPPRIDPRDEGWPVASQQVIVEVSSSEGEFGTASFSLPALEKPLPPGAYRLRAMLRFKPQDPMLREALKWCSALYGSRSTYDEETYETSFEPVLQNAKLHEEVYRYLLDDVRELKSDAIIYVGDTLKGRGVGLAGPGSDYTNILIHDYHNLVASEVAAYEHQLDNVDEVIDEQLAEKMLLGGNDVTREMIERWRSEAEDDKARIRRDNADLIEKYGGRLDDAERNFVSRQRDSLQVVLRQIAAFQDRLVYDFWVLVDGLLLYDGFHSVNVPGYNTWDAVNRNEVTWKPRPATKDDWERRREMWQYVPPEIREVAFKYLKRFEESEEWSPANFTETRGTTVWFLPDAWRTYQSQSLGEWYERIEAHLDNVRTTDDYAVQVWPDLLNTVAKARDDVLRQALSWEYLIRTDLQSHTEEEVTADWNELPESWRTLFPEKLSADSLTTPGAVKSDFEARCSEIRKLIRVQDFALRWRVALEEGTSPPGLTD